MGRSEKVDAVRINMPTAHICSSSLTLITTSPHLFLLPQPPRSPCFCPSALFLLSVILQISFLLLIKWVPYPPSFTHLLLGPASPPLFLPHGHSPFGKFIFPTLNHCLHHLLSPPSPSHTFYWDRKSLSFLHTPTLKGRSLFLGITNLSLLPSNWRICSTFFSLWAHKFIGGLFRRRYINSLHYRCIQLQTGPSVIRTCRHRLAGKLWSHCKPRKSVLFNQNFKF